MENNIVTTSEAATKKPAKTAPKKEPKPFTPDVIDLKDQPGLEETVAEVTPQKSPIPEKKVAKANSGKKFVYYSSGNGYSTRSGLRFTPEQRIYELDAEEADVLLKLDNFRLPNQLELEDLYKES